MLAPSYIHRPNSSRDDARLFHFAQREPPWAAGYAVVFKTEVDERPLEAAGWSVGDLCGIFMG